jgi:peptidoglycan/xylan/chitin deacetylase (PgdA/CDA1 family)
MAEIPFLTYHSVDGSGSPVSTAPRDFERQMAFLARAGYRTIRLGEAAALVRAREPLPERRLLISFDDGYRNNLETALPILRRHGFTAVVFVTTGVIGGDNSWPDQHPAIPKLPMMDPDELRALRAGGIDIGAHTHTHSRLPELGPTAVREELSRSKNILEDILGKSVDLFSYPFGAHDPDIRAVAADLFVAAIGNRPGRLHSGSDLYAIDRINACGKLFRRLPLRFSARNAFGGYLAMKRLVDGLRSVPRKP